MTETFPNGDRIVVSGFDVFSAPDCSILTSIANLQQIGMGIVLDFEEQNPVLFGHVKESYSQFLSSGFREINKSTNQRIDELNANRRLKLPPERSKGKEESFSPEIRNRHFAQNLFRKTRWVEPSVEKLDLTEQVTCVEAPNRIQEVEQIAKLIKRLVSDSLTLDLHRICITFYDLNIYAPLIREILPLYGIPYVLDWQEKLANSRLAVSILSLLDIIEGNANPRNKRKISQSPYFCFNKAINDVIDDWQFAEEISSGVFRRSFDGLMETLRVQQQILNGEKDEMSSALTQATIALEFGAYRQFRDLTDELVDFLSREYGDEQRHPLSVYVNWLKLMASQVTVETLPATSLPSRGGVCILPLVQTKERNFDVVILGGLVDGEFPAIFCAEAFLHHKQSQTESDQLREDRFLFYQALTLFREHLYLIVPQHEGDIELAQSPFIDELQRAATIGFLTNDNSVLSSTENFLKHYGRLAWAHENGIINPHKEDTRPVLHTQIQTTSVLSSSHPPPAFLAALCLIEHNVRVEKSRTIMHDLLQYEGWLSHDLLSPTSQRALEKQWEKVYSVSQLESYGCCPFQYFSDRVLKLNRNEEEEEGLTNREKGNLLYAILFEFYNDRRNSLPIAACTDPEFSAAAEDLKWIARKHLATAGYGGLFWEIDAETLIGGHGRTGILPTFLEGERERKKFGYPCYFEVGFGSSNRQEQTDPIQYSAAISQLLSERYPCP